MNDNFLLDIKFYSRQTADDAHLQYYCPSDFCEKQLKRSIKKLYNLLKKHKGEWDAD